MRLTLLGTGDAFSSGGRLSSSALLDIPGFRLLVDCGLTTLTALRRAEVQPSSVDAVLLTHLHGDHFGGVPMLLLDAVYNEPRTTPLRIVGPAGTGARVFATLDLLFPGVAEKAAAQVGTVVDEWRERLAVRLGPVEVTPFEVVHGSRPDCYALRISTGDRTVAFSGDTEWAPGLAAAAQGADLLLCECSHFERALGGHLSYRSLLAHQAELDAKRIVLTHLGADVLARLDEVRFETAHDGMVIEW